jgi:hypothetical protein
MPHGSGRRQRRDPARSEAQVATRNRPDSTDPRYWPAPRWTHELAEALHTDNQTAIAKDAAVDVAWTVLAQQRAAEARHRLDLGKAEEARMCALQQGISNLRDSFGVPQGAPLPQQAWIAAKEVHQASRLIPTPSPEPGATLPLGPDSRRPLRADPQTVVRA